MMSRPSSLGRALARGVPQLETLAPGTATGVGSLPHRSAGEATRFAFEQYDLPAIPTLPRRSPAEGMIAQAVVGIEGVTAGQYGSIAVDARRVDPCAPVHTEFGSDGYRGMRSFLHRAASAGYTGPVKWQFVGPVTLGVSLTRAGLTDELAFAVASRAVRSHLSSVAAAVSTALPESAQIVVIDEPWFGELMSPGFPIPPDPAIDLLSGAMAAVSGLATVGVHCCARADLASLFAAGPDLLSIPTHPSIANVAGYLSTFLNEGGRIAWGVVATDGPMFLSADRSWRAVRDLWDELARRGVEPEFLRDRSLVTPHCGLAMHSPGIAEKVCETVRTVGRRVATWTPRPTPTRTWA